MLSPIFLNNCRLTRVSHLFLDGCFRDITFEAIRTNAEEHYQDRTGHERGIKKLKDQADLIDPAASSHPLKLLVQDAHPGVNAFLHWLVSVLPHWSEQRSNRSQRTAS